MVLRNEIFASLVGLVTLLGFFAARWGRANMHRLDEWAFGGRHFGTITSWFLMGGDFYTAYTFIAVPALIYGAGAIGFYAVPYAALGYPLGFVVLARFWSIARARGYATAADFVRDRFGDRSLEIAIAITGVLALLPYIALQVIGMKAVLVNLGGVFAVGNGAFALSIAFILLAAYTYTSGLRAPAMIAFVKDTLIYATVIAAIIVIPARLHGWSHIFAVSAAALAARPKPASILLSPSLYLAYATMVFGSSLAFFTYPHSITSVLSTKSKDVVLRNMALLPAYSLLLGFLALLGYCAIAAGIKTSDTSSVIPKLIVAFLPDWFAGVALAAIVIGALVPAAVMAIGAANLFASNIFAQFHPRRTLGDASTARLLAIAICAFALGFAVFVPVTYAINFQLLGVTWMIQTVPAFIIGLYTRWFYPKALLAGWAAGMIASTLMAASTTHGGTGFSANITFAIAGEPVTSFIALDGFAINLLVAALLSVILHALRTNPGTDGTQAACDG